ncbi:MAG: PEP-CTERM sorting domain-containing protein [Fimbriimonadia bacterium]
MPLQGLGWSGIGASTYQGTPSNGFSFQANPNGGFGNGPWWSLQANFAYRVEAVPEPSTVALLGLGALALVRRRRK